MDTLWYIFDLGDGLAVPLSKFFAPLVARIVAQAISFSVNAAIWIAFAYGVAWAVKAA